MNEEKICFGRKMCGKGCSILSGEMTCDGLNIDCSFYKTRQQAVSDSDRAIDICRAKGLCENCRYMKSDKGKITMPCVKSTEV